MQVYYVQLCLSKSALHDSLQMMDTVVLYINNASLLRKLNSTNPISITDIGLHEVCGKVCLYVFLVVCEQGSECTNLGLPPQCHLVLY